MNGIELLKRTDNNRACWLLANGPSLNDVDLEWIQSTGLPVIGLNRIYLKHIPDYLVVVNDLVIDQWKDEISQVDCIKILPQRWADQYEWDDRTYFVNTRGSDLKFETELTEGIWEGHTVTFVAQQVAQYIGFHMIYLVGLDHDFGPIEALPNEQMVRMKTPDLAHFDEEYFPPGSLWNAPDLKMSELAYILTEAQARKVYTNNHVMVINLSARTKWRGFELANINQLKFSLNHENKGAVVPRVTAIVSGYHAKEFIKGCLEDLKAQTINDGRLEIILVCKKHSAEYRMGKKNEGPYFKVIATKDVPTVYEAWNMAIKEATGEYITNANTDDRHAPNALEIQMMALDALKHVDVVYYNSFVTWQRNQTFDDFLIENHGTDLVPGREEGRPGLFLWPEYTKEGIKQGCFIGPHPMWRHNLHQRYGLFDENFKSAGDYEFWLRIAKDDNFYHLNVNLGLYLARPDGVELSDGDLSLHETQMAMEMHQHSEMEIRIASDTALLFRIGPEMAMVNIDDLASVIQRIRTDKASDVDTEQIDPYHESVEVGGPYRK